MTEQGNLLEKRAGQTGNSFWHGRFVRYAPLVLWLGVIFLNSSTVGASSNTSRFIRPLLEWLFAGASADTIGVYHGYIRKLAHFVEYAALAFFAARAFRLSSQKSLRRFWPLWAVFFASLVAMADEYNQSFNSARTGSAYDVLIDVAGALSAVAALYFIQTRKGTGRSGETGAEGA